MSEVALGIMNSVAQYANDVLLDKVERFKDRLIYELKLLRTENAWKKSRGEEPIEIAQEDVINNLRIESHDGDYGVKTWVIYIIQEFQNTLDSDQAGVLWVMLENVKHMIGGS